MGADGTWKISLNSPMGAQDATLVLATEGDKVTGRMEGQQGTMEISDGTADGDNLTWKAELTQPMPMTLEFKAKVEGDNISGDVALGSFGNATFTGTRA